MATFYSGLSALNAAKSALLVLGLAILAILGSGQFSEFQNVGAVETSASVYVLSHLGGAFFGVSIVCASILMTPTSLAREKLERFLEDGEGVQGAGHQIVPSILGAAAIAITAISWHGCAGSSCGVLDRSAANWFGLAVALASAALCVWLSLALRNRRGVRLMAWRWFPRLAVAALIVTTLLSLLHPVDFGRFAGPSFLVFMFLSCVLGMIVLIAQWAGRFCNLALLGILLYSGFVSQLLYDENKSLRMEAFPAGQKFPKLSVETAFEQWLKCRPGIEAYRAADATPYPVFVVAAEGGGAYAARHVATVLAELERRAPGFASHIFAISGVSGGALGAAAVAAAIAERHPAPGYDKSDGEHVGTCSDGAFDGAMLFDPARVYRFVDSDHLSPVLAGALFPDFIQRFSPRAAPALDRAAWFEQSLIQTFKDTAPAKDNAPAEDIGNAFAGDVMDFWSPGSLHPALILNTVNVENGTPFAVFPFSQLRGAPCPDGSDFTSRSCLTPGLGQRTFQSVLFAARSHDAENHSISLAAAVSLSARFPYLFSPASVLFGEARTVLRFVDGGYFDNTGIQAAANLYDQLERYQQTPPQSGGNVVRFRPILIGISTDSDLPLAKSQGYAVFNDLLTPITSIYNTRRARTVATYQALRRSGIRYAWLRLTPDRSYDDALPLGLYLSRTTITDIEARVGGSVAHVAADCSVYADIINAELAGTPLQRRLPRDAVRSRGLNGCMIRALAELARPPI